ATVVLACRSLERGEAARTEIQEETGNPKLAVMELDLASQASVRAFSLAFAARYPKLHVLVNNAGIYTAKRTITRDGVESTFAVNHLSHFLLTNLLLPALAASTPSRVVTVASEANQGGTIHFEDLTLERWGGMRAYTQSKLANVLFTFELARRLDGTGVTANAVHPGGVRTNWSKGSGAMRFGVMLAWPFLIPPAKGADTVVYLASSPDVEGVTGGYFIRRKPAEPNPIAKDAEVARRLWEVSESLTGLRTADGDETPS
ncbi:MAG TPA: SDR family oxidoreductase, partial [Thermoplasmata archaeon]|nr:SDR family oxidoreductase [Thermoplasmata archaeon]